MQRRWLSGLAVVFVVLTAGVTAPVSGASGADSGVAPAQDPPQLRTPEGFDSTEFTLSVAENGTTRWSIVHRRALDNETEREQFEAFASRFNSTETDTYRDFKARAGALTSFGARETDRSMNATDFRKAARVEQPFDSSQLYGTLEMSFTWTNFARATGGQVVVADVFAGGMYIGPNQRLVFENGSGILFASAAPTPDSFGTADNYTASEFVAYSGEQNFSDQRPRVVFDRVDASGVGPESTSPATTTSESTTKSSELGPVPIVVVVLLLLVVGGAIAWYTGNLSGVLGGRDDDGVGAGTTAETDVPAEPETPAEPAVPEEDLLSDEDRVLELLEENGGRMKQVNIVENTEWSKSKVSMLLSDMEEEGLISKLRVGRENIISKAGEEPDAVGSPFEDE
jgi:hypothetical protein